MPSPENKLMQAWFAPLFKVAGFTKSGATWHRSRAPFIHVFNIQGSQWSRSFYFNLGVYITELGIMPRPPEYHCHIRERLDSLVPDRQHFFELAHFEREVPEEQRRTELQSAVSLYALPWLDRMVSREQLRHYVQREKKHGLPITRQAYGYLGITPA